MTDEMPTEYCKRIEKDIDRVDYHTYQTFPHLISRLKESCLCRLIKPEDFLELRIVPAQRE